MTPPTTPTLAECIAAQDNDYDPLVGKLGTLQQNVERYRKLLVQPADRPPLTECSVTSRILMGGELIK